MSSAEWLARNPHTHKCRLMGGHVRPDQCRRRKELAAGKTIAHVPNPFFTGGTDSYDLHESLRRCLQCEGPVELDYNSSIGLGQ